MTSLRLESLEINDHALARLFTSTQSEHCRFVLRTRTWALSHPNNTWLHLNRGERPLGVAGEMIERLRALYVERHAERYAAQIRKLGRYLSVVKRVDVLREVETPPRDLLTAPIFVHADHDLFAARGLESVIS
jgi:hypothetical protein